MEFWIVVIAGSLLVLGSLGAVYRIIVGPSLLDRVIAGDVLLAIFAAALALDMAVNKHLDNLILILVLSVVGFIGSVTVARFVSDRRG